jgi:PAS domain S-box-containing protein
MKQKQRLTIKLMLKGCNDTEFPVQLDCLPVNSMLHITLIDTSQFKQTSAALCEAETLALLIAERRKAEITCDEAYSRLNKTASLLFGMVYQLHLRADGRFCFPFVSEGIRNLYRLNPEEVIDDASKLFALIHPEDYEKLIDNLQKSALDLSPFVHEYRVLLEDGTLRWLLDNSMPLCEADGSTLWHGMTTDITEQKLIGRKLSYAYAFNNSILNSLSAHIAVLNNTGIITATNDAWRHFARDNGLP